MHQLCRGFLAASEYLIIPTFTVCGNIIPLVSSC